MAPATISTAGVTRRCRSTQLSWIRAQRANCYAERFVRTAHEDRWLPPSFGISPSYTCGIGITAFLLAVHIWHRLRHAILCALARRGLCCLDRGHDLFSSPAQLPAADR